MPIHMAKYHFQTEFRKVNVKDRQTDRRTDSHDDVKAIEIIRITTNVKCTSKKKI